MKQTVTLPLTTKKFLNEDEFSKMKMETLKYCFLTLRLIWSFPSNHSQHHTLWMSETFLKLLVCTLLLSKSNTTLHKTEQTLPKDSMPCTNKEQPTVKALHI